MQNSFKFSLCSRIFIIKCRQQKEHFSSLSHSSFPSLSRGSQTGFALAREIWSVLRNKVWGWNIVAWILLPISSSRERPRSLINIVTMASTGPASVQGSSFPCRGPVSVCWVTPAWIPRASEALESPLKIPGQIRWVQDPDYSRNLGGKLSKKC